MVESSLLRRAHSTSVQGSATRTPLAVSVAWSAGIGCGGLHSIATAQLDRGGTPWWHGWSFLRTLAVKVMQEGLQKVAPSPDVLVV